mgnify:CR=1 FL=1
MPYGYACCGILDDYLNGMPVVLFAYGLSGSGRSYTLYGPELDAEDRALAGEGRGRRLLLRQVDDEPASFECRVAWGPRRPATEGRPAAWELWSAARGGAQECCNAPLSS